jgi:hypothetical protein
MTAIAARSPMPGMLISRSIWVAKVPASPPVGSGPTRPIVWVTWVSIWSGVVDAGQVQGDQVAVVGGEPAGQGQPQVAGFGAQHPAGQSRQHHRVTLPGHQRLQHRPSRHPEGVKGDACPA